jgi:hypothetical protein
MAVAEALQEMPETMRAFRAGRVCQSKVKLLAQAQTLAPEQFAQDEARLLAEVAAVSPQQAPGLLAAWKQTADAGAAEAEAERLHARRALHLSKGWSGMLHLSGDLDPAGGLIVQAAIRSLSDPANLNPQGTRTPAQARADALVGICRHYTQGGGSRPRRPPRVLVTIPWSTLHQGNGIVDTEAGPISAGTARRLTCDATVSRVLLDPESVPVELGRATRVIPASLRQLLEARDRHCTWPGCDRPASWCDAHHVVHWAEGGRTDLDNLQLLCSRHHTAAHQGEWRPKRE